MPARILATNNTVLITEKVIAIKGSTYDINNLIAIERFSCSTIRPYIDAWLGWIPFLTLLLAFILVNVGAAAAGVAISYLFLLSIPITVFIRLYLTNYYVIFLVFNDYIVAIKYHDRSYGEKIYGSLLNHAKKGRKFQAYENYLSNLTANGTIFKGGLITIGKSSYLPQEIRTIQQVMCSKYNKPINYRLLYVFICAAVFISIITGSLLPICCGLMLPAFFVQPRSTQIKYHFVLLEIAQGQIYALSAYDRKHAEQIMREINNAKSN